MRPVPEYEREETPQLSFSTMQGSEKATVYTSGSMLPPDINSVSTFISAFPACRNVRQRCLLFKPSSLGYFAIVAQAKKHTHI